MCRVGADHSLLKISNIEMRLSEYRYRSISKFISLDAALVAGVAAL